MLCTDFNQISECLVQKVLETKLAGKNYVESRASVRTPGYAPDNNDNSDSNKKLF